MAKRFDTVDAKAARALVLNGRAPVLLNDMDEGERKALAALVGDDGLGVDGGPEKFRALMVAHNDRLKATDAADEGDE